MTFSDVCDIAEMSVRLMPTLTEAAMKEFWGNAAPRIEPTPDFGIDQNFRPGEIKVSSETISPFCRVWNFDGQTHPVDAPLFVIVAPNSGTKAQQMSAAVHAFLPHGNVRLVEQRDPHYVSIEHKNGLDDSTGALIKVLDRNPGAHVISFSQSGIPASVATAWMYQNPAQYKDTRPDSLTVIGSPVNPAQQVLSMNWMDWMAKHNPNDPAFVHIGWASEGCGREILPGTIPKLFFEKAPAESRAAMTPQALPAEHIRDTLKRVFRDYWLPRQIYKFNGELIRTDAITCDVLTVAGDQDRICSPASTHDLHRITPTAVSHPPITVKGAGHYKLVGKDVLTRVIAPAVVQMIARRTPARAFIH